MNKYRLKVRDTPLQVGWSAKIVAEFEPIAGCTEEGFWVRIESVDDSNGSVKYLGIIEDYLTYTNSHGLMRGFNIQFGPEHVSEIRSAGHGGSAN